MANRELVGTVDASRAIGIDPSTLTRWVKSGKATAAQKLPGLTGDYLFEPAEVERLAAAQAKALAS